MKKFLKFISLILICIFLYLICSMIPQTPLYRNNFSVENTAVVFGRIGRYDNQTVIGNLKINENGFYYLEVTDIPDYYFNEDGKMLIKVTRRGYEKPMLWNSQFQAYDRQVYLGNTKLIETEDYRLCTKAEVIELIDEGYEDKLAYIKRFKTKDTKYKEISEEEFKEYLKKYKSTINIRRFPQNGKYGDKGPYDGIIIFPKGKKPFLNFFHDMKISEANKEISEVNKGGSLSFGDYDGSKDDVMPGFNFIAPYFKSFYGDTTYDYNLHLPKAEPCFTPYKVKVWTKYGMTEEAKKEAPLRKERKIKRAQKAWGNQLQL